MSASELKSITKSTTDVLAAFISSDDVKDILKILALSGQTRAVFHVSTLPESYGPMAIDGFRVTCKKIDNKVSHTVLTKNVEMVLDTMELTVSWNT